MPTYGRFSSSNARAEGDSGFIGDSPSLLRVGDMESTDLGGELKRDLADGSKIRDRRELSSGTAGLESMERLLESPRREEDCRTCSRRASGGRV